MEEDSQEYSEDLEHVGIQLPDTQETKIWDDPSTTVREVALFLQTNKGKVVGEQYTPFELPNRFTFDTIESCIHDYTARQVAEGEKDRIKVDKLYCKLAGKSKSLVPFRSDHDLPAMLREYPLRTNTGRRKKSTIYMAVDWSWSNEILDVIDKTPAKSKQPTLRRSPCLQQQSQKEDIDVFVFKVIQGKTEIKVSQASVVMRGLTTKDSLGNVVERMKNIDPTSSEVFIPSKGLYWLRKGNKQMVSLKSEEDWKSCLDEYKDSKNKVKAVRLACFTDLTSEASAGKNSSTGSKRSLDFTSQNDTWNETHVSLVRDLEKKGIGGRYGPKHLKLWTDQIISGESAGVGDEPKWENIIDQIGVPPKSPRERTSPVQTTSSSPGSDDLLKAILLQIERRCEMELKRTEAFQNSLLAIMALNSPNAHPRQLGTFNNKKDVVNYSLIDCCDLLKRSNLVHLENIFCKAEVNGSLLLSMLNPHISNNILEGLGIVSYSDQQQLLEAIRKEMALSSTSTASMSFTE